MITQEVAEAINARAKVAAVTIAEAVAQKRQQKNQGLTLNQIEALHLGVWAGIFPTLLAANCEGIDTDIICERLYSIAEIGLREVEQGRGGRLPTFP